MNLKFLTDEALLADLKKLVLQEREVLTSVLHHLKEIERRRLFSALGFSSLYAYAVGHLGYSEDQAYRRISAMRLLKALPQMEAKLQDGNISLTNLSLAQTLFRREEKTAHFSDEKKTEILEKLQNKTSREAQKIVLEYSTQPERFVPERVRPVTHELTELKFVVTEEVLEKLEKLKGLLAHSDPNISLADLVNKLCDLGIQKWDPALKPGGKRKSETILLKQSSVDICLPKASINSETSPESQKIGTPAAPKVNLPEVKLIRFTAQTRREIWAKAQSRCQTCGSSYALQIDHRIPRALRGSNDLSNLRLLCRNCNQRAAIQVFGVGKMNGYLVRKR